MSKPRNFLRGTYHHLYNRGVNRQVIFFDRKDYLIFLKRLRRYKAKYDILVLCYCLMPDHFHLFVKQSSNFSTGKFIGDLTNSYTKSINVRYHRSGVLFEGRTKNKHITKQEYFIWLARYILRNPVEAKLVEKPHLWEFSSTQNLFRIRKGNLVSGKDLLSSFGSVADFRRFVEDEKDTFDYTNTGVWD